MNSFRTLGLALAAALIVSTTAFAQQVRPGAPTATAPPAAATQPAPAKGVQAPPQPAPAATVTVQAAPANAPKVNINDPGLTVQQVDLFFGVGEVKGPPIFAAIKASIAKDGAFVWKEDLVKRGVVTPALFAGFKSQVVLVDLNNTCKDDMVAILNGVGAGLSDAIDTARKAKPFAKIEDVQNVNGIGPATYGKIADEITVTAKSPKPWKCFTH